VSRPGQAVEVECWCVCVNICMNDGALRAVKKLYIRLCAARDSGCVPQRAVWAPISSISDD
jgi:hypothetical protein